YGNNPSLTAPTDPNAPQFTQDSHSFSGILTNLNPVPALPTFAQYDQGLSHPTAFEAFNIYVPWIPWEKRGAGIPPHFQVSGINPNNGQPLVPLNLSPYFAASGSQTGLASLVGPFTVDTGGFVPRGQPLPFTVNFQNDPQATTHVNQVRVVINLDPNL